MLSILLLTTLAVAGQPAPAPKHPQQPPAGDARIHNDWEGRFTGPGCLDGKVALTTEQRGAELTGTYSFVADLDGDPNEGVKALYRVEGERSGSRWTLAQQALVNADDLKGSADWCFGVLTLQEARIDGLAALTGTWEAPDCGCTGTVQLTAAQRDAE